METLVLNFFIFQGICDGAASLVLASEKAVKEHGLTPLARLVSYYTSGVEPSIMGIGPVPAIMGALSRAGKTLNDMDLIEVGRDTLGDQWLHTKKRPSCNRSAAVALQFVASS